MAHIFRSSECDDILTKKKKKETEELRKSDDTRKIKDTKRIHQRIPIRVLSAERLELKTVCGI